MTKVRPWGTIPVIQNSLREVRDQLAEQAELAAVKDGAELEDPPPAARQALNLIEAQLLPLDELLHDQLRSVGLASGEAMLSRHAWIHRVVDRVTFPDAGVPTAHRDFHIDFTIPLGLAPVQVAIGAEQTAPAFYLPLLSVRKGLLMSNVTAVGEDGTLRPFLTSSEAELVAVALLNSLADRLALPKGLPDGLLAELVATAPPHIEQALTAAVYGLVSEGRGRHLDAAVSFMNVATHLALSRVLWVPVVGRPGQRSVARIGFDIKLPVAGQMPKPFVRGLPALSISLDVCSPDTAVYHLEVAPPAPLRVLGAQVINAQLMLDPSRRQPEAESSLRASREAAITVEPSTGSLTLTGTAPSSAPLALIALGTEKRTVASATAVVAVLVTGLLLTFALTLSAVLRSKTGALALLLFAPALIAYFEGQRSHHILVNMVTNTVRKILALLGLLPIIAAATLVSIGTKPTPAVHDVWDSLVAVSVVASLLLVLLALRLTKIRNPSTSPRRTN